MPVRYIVTDSFEKLEMGEVARVAGHLEIWEANEQAQDFYIATMGRRRPFILGIERMVVVSVTEWKPSDADIVAVTEKALVARKDD